MRRMFTNARDWFRSVQTHRGTQMVVAGVLSSLIGFTLQFTKLTALDSSSRQYARDSYAGKVSFLAVFGVSKAFANLSVALLSRLAGYKLTELSGWVLALAVMPPLFSGPGGGAAGSGWAAVVGSCVVLGVQQGLCWSVTVLALILLMPGRRSGLASGLNETLGYVAVAAAAPVYGLLEPLAVSCGWAVPLSDLSPACRTAAEAAAAAAAAAATAAATAGGLGALGTLPGLGAATGAANGTELLPAGGGAAAAATSEQLLAAACTTADNWQSACVGECVCHGYNTLASKALLLLLPTGLLLTALLMGEPAAAVAAAMAAAAGRRRTEAQAEAGQGAGAAPGGQGKASGLEMKAFGWKGRLGGSGGTEAGADGGRYARVRGDECPQPGMAALAAAGTGSSSSAALNGHGGAVPGGGGSSSSSNNGGGGLQPSLQPVLLPVSTPPVAIGGYSRRQPLAGEGAEEKEGLMRSGEEAGAERQGLLSGTGAAGGGVFVTGGGGGVDGGGGGSWLSRLARRCSLSEVLYYSWTNRSTSVMCAAGLLSNALTSLAWGLLLAWARDDPSLRVPGPGRNLLASAYSFLKGLTQLLSGGVSDAAGVGRRPPVVLGLLLNCAGLLTAACGAGWGGALLSLSGVSQGSSPQEVEARRATAYGYLMLASCLMGAGAGVFYPVMPAAMADHARDWASKQPRAGAVPESQGLLAGEAAAEEDAADDDDDGHDVRAGKRLNAPAPHAHPHHPNLNSSTTANATGTYGDSSTGIGSGSSNGSSGSAASHALAAAMSTFRFWRDLGYAVGALGGPAADALGVEVTLLGTAGVCMGMAGLVGWRYEEVAVPAHGDGDGGGSSHGWH
ncbi:hypothetical protein HYH02_009652 [Chlamydomonas schloesseri]|uniref:Uncharacterized protein n=1 Tax=Chlamydomonas schloesseri TaxID=2026947 RepID=A0A835TB50_9CHLO|nr:hypothetical protein HYH02_009652 [Chlamydomonas schloesseri]|eukprot:KAG2442164.1 hypothetical protein HYH02_009652 [Chlamydomonas schloesseri]